MFIVAAENKNVVEFLWNKYHKYIEESNAAWKTGKQKDSYILRVKAKDVYEDLKTLDPRPVYVETEESVVEFKNFDEAKNFLTENRQEITSDGRDHRFTIWFSDDIGVTNCSFYDVFHSVNN